MREVILDFPIACDLVLVTTYFNHYEEHLITFRTEAMKL